jgi:hypothetical protein
MHTEELRDLYSAPSIIRMVKSRRVRWAGHVVWMREKRNAFRLLVGKLERRRPQGRSRRRWEDNIKMDLDRTGGGGDWLGLAKDRDKLTAFVNAVMHVLVP